MSRLDSDVKVRNPRTGEVDRDLAAPTSEELTALVAKQKTLDDAAIALVVAAEANDLQASLTTAKTAVDLLKDGDAKTSLLARITAQQVIVDLTAEVKTVEAAVSSSATKQAEIDAVLLKVEALEDSTAKTLLLREIAGVQKVSDLLNASAGEKRDAANAAVTVAEASFTQADVTAANTAVAALPDGLLKTRLAVRVAAVATVVTAVETAVAAAESAKTQASLDAAVTAVSAMTDSTGKTAFASRNTAVKAIIDAAAAAAAEAAALAAKVALENAALTAVQAAADADTKETLDAATASVNALPAGELKTRLLAVLGVQADVTAAAEAKLAEEASKGSVLVGISFSTGSSKLSASALKKLVNEAKAVKAEHKLVSITVQGVGANRDLALNRAVSIISALKKAGFSVRVTLSTSTKASSTARVTFNWQD